MSKSCSECQHYTRSQTGPHEWKADCALRMADFMSAADCASYSPIPLDHASDEADDRWPYSGKETAPVIAPAPHQRQVGGDHYLMMTVQPWDALQAWLTPNQFEGFLLGTAMVYLARFNAVAPGKGGVQDVEKAIHTLERLVDLEKHGK